MCGCAIHHSSAMLRKSVLIKNNIKYESKYSPAEDYALWCRLIGKTKFYNIQEVLIFYRKHPNQTSNKQQEKMINATKMIHKFVRKDHPDLWHDVCCNSYFTVRLKLFNLIPLGKFVKKGNQIPFWLKYVFFIKTKLKYGGNL